LPLRKTKENLTIQKKETDKNDKICPKLITALKTTDIFQFDDLKEYRRIALPLYLGKKMFS
jgi:hypothetical protein